MREIRTSGLTRGRVLPSLLYRFNLFFLSVQIRVQQKLNRRDIYARF